MSVRPFVLGMSASLLLACGPGSGQTGSGEDTVAVADGAIVRCPVGTVPECTSTGCVCVRTSYSIPGTVTGLTGTGLSLINSGFTLDVPQNGTYSFSMPGGECYDVLIDTQPANQACTISNNSGCASGTPWAVTCGQAYTVGGTISGFDGTAAPAGLSLLLTITGGVETTPQIFTSNGGFTFSTPVAVRAPAG